MRSMMTDTLQLGTTVRTYSEPSNAERLKLAMGTDGREVIQTETHTGVRLLLLTAKELVATEEVKKLALRVKSKELRSVFRNDPTIFDVNDHSRATLTHVLGRAPSSVMVGEQKKGAFTFERKQCDMTDEALNRRMAAKLREIEGDLERIDVGEPKMVVRLETLAGMDTMNMRHLGKLLDVYRDKLLLKVADSDVRADLMDALRTATGRKFKGQGTPKKLQKSEAQVKESSNEKSLRGLQISAPDTAVKRRSLFEGLGSAIRSGTKKIARYVAAPFKKVVANDDADRRYGKGQDW